jgi:hypothetical protein
MSNVYRGVKKQGQEVDHPSANYVEVKETWIYTSTPQFTLMA